MNDMNETNQINQIDEIDQTDRIDHIEPGCKGDGTGRKTWGIIDGRI
jgi:hypothetical protein